LSRTSTCAWRSFDAVAFDTVAVYVSCPLSRGNPVGGR
jgi:hypothetical protein